MLLNGDFRVCSQQIISEVHRKSVSMFPGTRVSDIKDRKNHHTVNRRIGVQSSIIPRDALETRVGAPTRLN